MSPAANPIAERLSRQPFIVLDGALATELERRGADLRDPLWSAKYLLESPDAIRAVHRDYFRAGADVATTATYQATFEGFERRGIGRDRAVRLMRDAVALAAEARDEFWADPSHRRFRDRPLVAASVGPYGAMLADGSEYRGRYGVSDRVLGEFHRPRLEILAGAGADLIACETLPCLREALVLARLLEEFPGLSAWISFSCRDGEHNCEGERISDCAAALRGLGQIAALGVNCTPPRHVAALLGRMGAHADKPLLAYPNSGEGYDARSKRWTGPAERGRVADHVLEWYRAGARLIGGCCRTTPEDIGDVRAQVQALADLMV
ncbi:MAG TPA: homocysteine S-methyltransferase [Steroidobacteraceae bacterium]|nr:homocysteine S-methyltransferase [Steroidobacteraceae bacterium]